MRLVFRADAGTVPEIGTGHMIRSLEVARALQNRDVSREREIRFLTRSEGPFGLGASLVQNRGFHRLPTEDLEPNSSGELEALLEAQPGAVVFDRLATSTELVLGLREHGITVCTFDDLGPGQAHADVAIHSLLQDVTVRENVYVGYEYLILPDVDGTRDVGGEGFTVLASFGGYDRRRFSDLLLKVVDKVQGPPIRYDLLAGSLGVARLEDLKKIAGETGNDIHVYGRVENFHHYLARADLAIVSGGMTAFQCARSGIPAIGLPQYEHQLPNLHRLREAGCLELPSAGMEVDAARVADLVEMLRGDGLRRKEMSDAGQRLVDGHGLARVVRIIERALETAEMGSVDREQMTRSAPWRLE